MSIEKLRAAYAAATPRPWEVLMTAGMPHVACLTESGIDVMTIAACDTRADAEFIALAWQMMPDLLRAVEVIDAAARGNTESSELEEMAGAVLYKLHYGKELSE